MPRGNPKRIRKTTPSDIERIITLKEYNLYRERTRTRFDSYNEGAQAIESEKINKEAKTRQQIAPYIYFFLTRRTQQT